MSKLDDAEITAKCVEISKCLVNIGAGMVNYDLRDSRTIGDASRIAVSIKRAGEIDKETFAAISTALKVDFRFALSEIINLFEDLSWVETRRKGKNITKIVEMIPPTEDVLSTLGKVWEEQEPTVIDVATVHGLHRLSRMPFEREALISELDIANKEFQTLYEYGEQAQYLGNFTSLETGKQAIWTPLYWASHTDEVLRFLEKQTEEGYLKLGRLTRELIRYAGTPDEKMTKSTQVDAGIYHGFFPTVRIRDRQGKEHEYTFAATPQFEVDPKKDIFERARMIVSCIRHGQYHAEVTRVLYPRSILRAMRTNSMKPHPYADVQYILLKTHGLVDLEPSSTRYGKAFRVRWIDTPENNLAADIADVLLRGHEPAGRMREEVRAKEILVQGMFNYSSEQRRIRAAKKVVAKEEYDRMMELMTGVRI